MPKMNFLVILDHLEELFDTKFQIAGKVMVNKDEVEELLQKIRIALPQEIKEAEWVNREKDRYLSQAQEEAKRILREAESYAERLVREDQIVSRAEEEARRILSEAKHNAADIEAGARQFANQILEQLEESLDRTLKVVRQSRDEL